MTTWLDMDGLAAYLGVPKSTLYKLQQKGELPSYKLGRKLLFDTEEIDKAIKQGRKRPPQRGEPEKPNVPKSKAS
jgi:excisionase family DNA binding protein